MRILSEQIEALQLANECIENNSTLSAVHTRLKFSSDLDVISFMWSVSVLLHLMNLIITSMRNKQCIFPNAKPIGMWACVFLNK